jgi:phosphate transport system ATP-binding protein
MVKKKIEIKDLWISYSGNEVLTGVSMDIYENEVLAIIGPANSGKSSFLKSLNRMTDFIPGCAIRGDILLDGQSIYVPGDSSWLRQRVGMVSPLPVGLPMSIIDNVTYGPRMAGERDRTKLTALAEDCLRKAALWDEVKDRLDGLATKLSGGQQQRLTIARALSLNPEVLFLDEFSIAIDPVTTMKIEDVLMELKKHMTIVVVTNVISQAKRLGDRTAMMLEGKLLDLDSNERIFSGEVKDKRTTDYINGIFG